MIRVTGGHDVVAGKVKYFEYSGLSTDTKPVNGGTSLDGETIGIATGSLFIEVDTGDAYFFNEEGTSGSEWVKVGGGNE